MPSAQIVSMLWIGLLETLQMTVFSTALAYVIGLPLGIILVITKEGNLWPNKSFNLILNTVINLLRSVPFLILLIAVIPITRFVVGTTIGAGATVVPLVIASFPFVARLVESSLEEVNNGVIEAAQSMGASNIQTVLKVMLVESLPSLLSGATIAVTTILSYSAMAGIVAGGGLGDIAIRFGYYRYQKDIMLMTIIVLIILVQLLQSIGSSLVRAIDKRSSN